MTLIIFKIKFAYIKILPLLEYILSTHYSHWVGHLPIGLTSFGCTWMHHAIWCFLSTLLWCSLSCGFSNAPHHFSLISTNLKSSHIQSLRWTKWFSCIFLQVMQNSNTNIKIKDKPNLNSLLHIKTLTISLFEVWWYI